MKSVSVACAPGYYPGNTLGQSMRYERCYIYKNILIQLHVNTSCSYLSFHHHHCRRNMMGHNHPSSTGTLLQSRNWRYWLSQAFHTDRRACRSPYQSRYCHQEGHHTLLSFSQDALRTVLLRESFATLRAPEPAVQIPQP